MKLPALTIVLGFIASHAFGQGAQADQIKRRARETVNQNNVRQGVPSPAPTTPPKSPPPAAPGPAPVSQAQSLAKIKADLAGFKTGSLATAEQKQQFTIDLAVAARGSKPSLGTMKKFVDSMAAGLAEASLTGEQQARLAQDLDAVLNSKPLPATQFDAIIADMQAILQVGGVKRAPAAAIAADLKNVGAEVRR
jgi:hypothetical protein